MFETRKQGRAEWKELSLTGGSTLVDLVRTFGDVTQRLRAESLDRVARHSSAREMKFTLKAIYVIGTIDSDLFSRATYHQDADTLNSSDDTLQTLQLLSDEIPNPFWPTLLGTQY